MPWVRLHALKDYLDMPLRATRHSNTKVTFNLVPSLLDQIQHYLNGGTDRHLELSQLDAEALTPEDRQEILDTFFNANPPRMILPYPRFRELFDKARSGGTHGKLIDLFSSSEFRDLQVWSSLCWVDPLFRSEEPISALLSKERHFTELDKQRFFQWQRALLDRIIPTYQKLFSASAIDLSFTPYYHPILPLLCDTNSALEALPELSLPQNRFRHPEDAEWHIKASCENFPKVFGAPLQGMWPSEGSISAETLTLMRKHGITWSASDEEVLYCSLRKSKLAIEPYSLYQVYEHNGLKLFFRDHSLSDRIGFVYAGWPAERAVSDFIDHLGNIRERCRHHLDSAVVPVILDGENAWEYFPDDGAAFLDLLYTRLAEDKHFALCTFSEAARSLPARQLPEIHAGSWIHHNFRVWIGHPEDNLAWDLLSETRDTLVRFEADNPKYSPALLLEAWEELRIAQGSDWCWWYGDEHVGPNNPAFDLLYRQHLAAVYTHLDLPIPYSLQQPVCSVTPASYVSLPEALVTPQIDGTLSHFYEWSGAGQFACSKVGGSMHRVERLARDIYFAYDHEKLYARIDLESGHQAADYEFRLQIKDGVSYSSLQSQKAGFICAVNRIFEAAIDRTIGLPRQSGKIQIAWSICQDGREFERWPIQGFVSIEVPEPMKELFWL